MLLDHRFAPAKPAPDRPVGRIRDGDHAIETARAFAATIAPGSAARDRDRRLPFDEIEQLAGTGLLAITVPHVYGGIDVSAAILAEVIAIIAEADSSIGQIPQNHFYLLEALRTDGSDEQQRFFFGRVLEGDRFFNALSETASANAHAFTTKLSAEGDGFRLNGRKAYSTGTMFADWIVVLANNDDGKVTLSFIEAKRDGVTVVDDWGGLGQRTTASGTTVFDNVAVSAFEVVQHHKGFERPSTIGSVGQIIHAAVDLGIARAAFADTVDVVRHRARPAVDSGRDKATDDPLTIARIGDLYVRLEGATALLARAGRLIDAERLDTNETTAAHASVAVAEAKVATTEISLLASTVLFELGGTRTALVEHNFDRHWRNARTHTLHDPVRWKYHTIGNWWLNGVRPPYHGAL